LILLDDFTICFRNVLGKCHFSPKLQRFEYNVHAEMTFGLLKNREMARQMGENGKEHVRTNFLIISQLRDNLRLFNQLLETPEKTV